MSADTAYTCAACGGTFALERSDAEARAEFKSLFGRPVTGHDAIVCDDCHAGIMAAKAAPHCRVVSNTHVMPGWVCCQCSMYNGLQRDSCRSCVHDRCALEIPANVVQCPDCGFGCEGRLLQPCPCCQSVQPRARQ